VETTCSGIRRAVRGKTCALYAFTDGGIVYYVGQTTDVLRRVGREHCGAHIGGSEGVVRFLMYLLDKVCSDQRVRGATDVVEREEIVAGIIRDFLSSLSIVLAVCEGEPGRECLARAEECAKTRLRPRLNPP